MHWLPVCVPRYNRRGACLTMNCYIAIGWLFGGLNFALLDLVALLSLLSEFALSILLEQGSSTQYQCPMPRRGRLEEWQCCLRWAP